MNNNDVEELLDETKEMSKNDVEQNNTPQNVNNNSFQVTTTNIPSEYKPISMWGYFGYEILFSIPCIGFILLLVFAFGGTSNINLRNFARSYFCFFIIGLILIGILVFLLLVSGVTVPNNTSSGYGI